MFVFVFCILSVSSLSSQTISQIGFIIKQGLPETETVIVMVNKAESPRVKAEARTAVLVTKKQFLVFDISTLGDISKTISNAQKMKNVVVLMIADSKILEPKSIKYASHKLGLKQIPLISTRENDTKQGALLAIYQEGEAIERHVNNIVADALKVKFPPEFLAACIVDVNRKP